MNTTSETSDTTAADQESSDSLRPQEGWHVLHLFYQIDHREWDSFSADEKLAAKTELTKLAQEIRATPETQLLTFSILTPKADIAFMLLTPDLHVANAFEKRLTRSLGPDVLSPVYGYLSMTERSEYTTTSEQYGESLEKDKQLAPDSEEYKTAMEEFEQRMKKYGQDRLYPNMPDWPVFCFYTMNKRRTDGNNWYHMEFESRRKLMAGHAMIGRQWAGKIRQLITGSTGIDDAEWGVTLFAHDTYDVKGIVYQMRFDEVTAKYGDFGDFYIGIQLQLDALFRRLGL
jgi:chlorite dismutase